MVSGMPDRDTTSRLYKAASRWLWDWLIEHWPQILMVGGAGVMTYLASIAAWLQKYGPLAYGVIGLGTYLLLMVGYWLYGITRKNVASSRLADERWKTSSINPLDGNFTKQRIKLSDFFNPFYVPVRSAKFQGCELLGPANIILIGCNLSNDAFNGCQAVITEEGKHLIGVTVFMNCIFEGCIFFQVTIYMTKQDYISMKQQTGSAMEIISDGNAGNL